MLSLSELGGLDLRWEFDTSSVIPASGDRHYVLFRGSEPVVTAQASWRRLVFFDVVMESDEGTYFVHVDLTVPDRRAVVWRAGEQISLAGFALFSGPSVADEGIVTTASGRTMQWKPKYLLGLPTIEYTIEGSSDASLIPIVPALGSNTSGTMRIAAAMAPDPELAPLVALAFALTNEQGLMLHPVVAARGQNAATASAESGKTAIVLTGNLGLFVGSLVISITATLLVFLLLPGLPRIVSPTLAFGIFMAVVVGTKLYVYLAHRKQT